jgi:hypothetical protein
VPAMRTQLVAAQTVARALADLTGPSPHPSANGRPRTVPERSNPALDPDASRRIRAACARNNRAGHLREINARKENPTVPADTSASRPGNARGSTAVLDKPGEPGRPAHRHLGMTLAVIAAARAGHPLTETAAHA